ncbi:MAG: phage tail protein [bacterium]|nr:phage tail protein [bacterium]
MYVIRGTTPAVGGEWEFMLHDLRSEEYVITEAVSTAALNSSGSFTFKIAPNHPHYNDLIKMVTLINVYQDNSWLYTYRIIDVSNDIWNVKTVVCEGDLGFLNDSNQRSGEYHNISPAEFMKIIIDKHNADVDERKRFTLGTVNVTDPNDSIYRYANYEDSWTYINDKLINRLGGYVRTRYVGDTRYIDYVSDYGSINSQQIVLGENVIDMLRTEAGHDIATVAVPLGATLKDEEGNDSGVRLTVEDAAVGGSRYGRDYIENPNLIGIYGRIVKPVIFEDVTTADYLYKAGSDWLAAQTEIHTLELSAIDLHLADKDIERFRLGDYVQVVSEKHGINTYMKISGIEIDYNNAENFKLTLGAAKTTVSEAINKAASNTAQKLNEQAEEIRNIRTETSEFRREITENVNSLSVRFSESTDIQTLLSEIRQDFSSTITQTARDITLSFTSQVIDVQNDVINAGALIEEYIRFKGALIELGKVGSAFTAKLSNEELGFYEYGKKIAYISGSKLNIVQAEVTKLLTLGNDNIGKFDFLVKSNGNLAFKWRDLS